MMTMSERLCLRWEDFSTTLNSYYQKLRDDSDFYDVTLASEDKQLITAHKVVLAMASPMFKNILKFNKHAHPFI